MADKNTFEKPATVAGTRKMIVMLLVFATGCLIGAAAGGYAGFLRGRSLILNDALFKDAREVGTRINVLKQLRTGEKDKAVESLETGLSDLLIIFDPDRPYPGLDIQTVDALGKAIGQAREYRKSYPRPVNERDFREKMVQNLFSRELYKQTGAGK